MSLGDILGFLMLAGSGVTIVLWLWFLFLVIREILVMRKEKHEYSKIRRQGKGFVERL